LLLKAIFRKLHEFKTYFFKIKLSSGFVAQGYFLEKVYRFLSEYEYEYAIVRSAICLSSFS